MADLHKNPLIKKPLNNFLGTKEAKVKPECKEFDIYFFGWALCMEKINGK